MEYLALWADTHGRGAQCVLSWLPATGVEPSGDMRVWVCVRVRVFVGALLQFSLWATMAAPLLIGSSILNLTAWDLETYTNAEVIAVDQDALGCDLVMPHGLITCCLRIPRRFCALRWPEP